MDLFMTRIALANFHFSFSSRAHDKNEALLSFGGSFSFSSHAKASTIESNFLHFQK